MKAEKVFAKVKTLLRHTKHEYKNKYPYIDRYI